MFPSLKIKYSSLSFQGRFGFKKESDDDENKMRFKLLHVTPELKPFTVLRSLGRQSERLKNDCITYASTVTRIRQQLCFYKRCKDYGLVPAGLKLKSPLNTQGPSRSSKPPAHDWLKRG